MNVIALLGSLTLGISMVAGAQQSTTTPRTPPVGTPPTFPQQTTPDTRTTRDNYPPDTTAPKGTQPAGTAQSGGATGNSPSGNIQGCLNQSGSGFVLTSQAGILYQLQGNDAEFARHVGQEVTLSGEASNNPGAPSTPAPDQPDATTAESSSTGAKQPAPLNSFTVSSITKVADSCSPATR